MLTSTELKKLLHYDPLTGIFTWLPREDDNRFNAKLAGRQAGSPALGYWRISVNHKSYLAHRLAWLYCYGEHPKYYIDHIDRNPMNNAISNLRDVPQKINIENQIRQSGESGQKGVHKKGKRWLVRIVYKNKRINLGTYGTVEEATIAYKNGLENIEKIYQERQHQLSEIVRYKKPLTYDELLEKLSYDQETGVFSWKALNKIAGSLHPSGYRCIKVNDRSYGAHVLAVFYMIGSLPNLPVDHINGIKDDNRWSNLRVVSISENNFNRKGREMRGVSPSDDKWIATVYFENERHYVGYFDTQEEAKEAWNNFVVDKGWSHLLR